MAVRLGRLFGNGPNLWLNMQRALDLWEVINANSAAYEQIKAGAFQQQRDNEEVKAVADKVFTKHRRLMEKLSK